MTPLVRLIALALPLLSVTAHAESLYQPPTFEVTGVTCKSPWVGGTEEDYRLAETRAQNKANDLCAPHRAAQQSAFRYKGFVRNPECIANKFAYTATALYACE